MIQGRIGPHCLEIRLLDINNGSSSRDNLSPCRSTGALDNRQQALGGWIHDNLMDIGNVNPNFQYCCRNEDKCLTQKAPLEQRGPLLCNQDSSSNASDGLGLSG